MKQTSATGSRARGVRALIDVGMIAFGPELERRPIYHEVTRLRRALRSKGTGPSVEVVYVVPGSLGRGDFSKDMELKRSRAGNTFAQVFVVVPEAVAVSSQPMAALIGLAREALAFANVPLSQGDASVDFDAMSSALAAAEAAVLGPGADARHPEGQPATASPELNQADDHDEDAAGVEVLLPVDSDPTAVDRAFALESELEDRLESDGVGYVDGNEVGEGTFQIFTYGPSLPALRDAVLSVVQARWPAGATLRLLDGDREIDRLTT